MKAFSPHILYEDNHLLVVVKPANLPVQADASGDPDLLSLLKADLKERHQKPGNVFLGLVHRLDRPVGGVMVFAKTSKAAARLSEAIRTRQFHKEYLVVVHGSFVLPAGTLHHYLRKNSYTNITQAFAIPEPGAKEALLSFNVLAEADQLSLVRVQLQTGRSHQIRVQFAVTGHPLWGDQKYGADYNQPGQPIALWAERIGFQHPTLAKQMEFSAASPRDYPWSLFGDI
jgi:23S rRNA pseudouridine1911/1915/1917 synthase